ncbi:hypothetical protein ACLIYP_07545 [Streptomyces nanhaiensis]|uniref:hypothetical protein n=1 Tax=Streptomyces nanhaiensis TaxID=679319 RepID=UPI00399D49B8
MNVLTTVAGCALVALALADAVITSLSMVTGTGPTRRPPARCCPPWTRVLDTLQGQFFSRAEQELPAPPLSVLRRAGVPAVGEERYTAGAREHARRRRSVRGFLHSDGWWDDRDGRGHRDGRV